MERSKDPPQSAVPSQHLKNEVVQEEEDEKTYKRTEKVEKEKVEEKKIIFTVPNTEEEIEKEKETIKQEQQKENERDIIVIRTTQYMVDFTEDFFKFLEFQPIEDSIFEQDSTERKRKRKNSNQRSKKEEDFSAQKFPKEDCDRDKN